MDSKNIDNENGEPSTSSKSLNNNDKEEQSSSSSSMKRKIDDDNQDNEQDSDDNEVDFETLCSEWNEQIEQVETVTGMFGNSDENNCTYIDDDLIRQPLYACSTCEMNNDNDNNKKYQAGICFACAENCHKGHDLFELYTKRNFRCDCGNDKFLNLKCKLFNKIGLNESNQYNHNFNGLYCTCELPYPCDDFDDTMLQCGICEDWFHQSHLDSQPIKGYSDMICMNCVRKYTFLVYYQMDGKFNFTECDDKELLDKELKQFCDNLENNLIVNNNDDDECKLDLIKTKFNNNNDDDNEKILEQNCHTLYLPLDWRQKICCCKKCRKYYNDNNIDFITNPNDMFAVYIYRNQQKVSEKEQGNRPKLNRLQEIIVAEGIEHYKKVLGKFLERCKEENCKTISAKDIDEFKKNLLAKKRNRLQYFCR